MAEDVLVLDVKTNIGEVTKDTKEYKKSLEQVNDEINLQTKFIIAQEKELIRLKAQQDAIPKGAWVAGMNTLNDKIRETTAELNDEKNGLKSLKQEQKEATQEVKKHKDAQKENNKESVDTIGNFKVMGVSLNGIKKGFSKIIPTAKAMFGTIRAGMISTGIGALVIGVMALIQSFKSSEAGQEKFQRIMAAIGAVTSQVLDLFADLGETIIEAVTSPMKALESLGNGIVKFFKDPIGATRDLVVKTTIAVKDFVDETAKEIKVLGEVTKARQKAHHIERELKVDRAKADREINDIRLQAEDREKFNATERIALLRKAQKIEEDITAKEIRAKQLLVDAQILEMAQGKETIEDKDKLAQLQAELINLDTKKLRSQRLLQTQITTAINEEKAIKEQAAKEAQDVIDAEWDAKIKANDEWNKEQQINAKKEIALAKKVAKEKADLEKFVQESKMNTITMGFKVAGSLAKEGSAAAKGIAVANTIFNTQQSIMKAMADVPYPYNIVQSALNGIMGANAVSKIMSTDPSGAGGSSGGGAVATASAPAPQMMSGAFDISGGVAPEATKAYVVTDEMSNSQNQLANIRRRATI
jgi:hypothetical protein